MRFRKRPSHLILLLLPSLATALTAAAAAAKVENTPTSNFPKSQLRDAASVASQSADPPSKASLNGASAKFERGTKDAPVDGKDGKPHTGPWVDLDPKKADKGDPELVRDKQSQLKNKPSDPSILDLIPQSNDGVMDDPKRVSPKVGTTGTEGGITEKDKARKAKEGQTGERLEKVPDSPKGRLPPPDQRIGKEIPKKTSQKESDTKDGKKEEKDDGLGGLEKPKDLPEKPHDGSNPLPNSANKDHLDISKPDSKSTTPKQDAEDPEGIIQPKHSYFLALAMILSSEVGDKTFLIAALMAMKHDRKVVFSAALSALVAMTVLSALLGRAAPFLFAKRTTNFIASGLFLFFGGRLVREGLAMSPDEGTGKEMSEVEMEMEEKAHQAKNRRSSSVSPFALEMGMGLGNRTRKSRSSSRLPEPARSPSSSPELSPQRGDSTLDSISVGLTNLFSLLLSPAWVQTFIMTFLGEWGDRSQIATIAMAAGQDFWWVTGGAISGHAVCTGAAVLGGRWLAGKVSMKIVTYTGAFFFLLFGVIYFYEAYYF